MTLLSRQLKLSELKNHYVRLIAYLRERKATKLERSKIRMAVLSGSIRRIK